MISTQTAWEVARTHLGALVPPAYPVEVQLSDDGDHFNVWRSRTNDNSLDGLILDSRSLRIDRDGRPYYVLLDDTRQYV